MRYRTATVRRALAALAMVLALSACTVEQSIRWAFRDHPEHVQDQAVQVAWCESRHDPTATNGQYRGLFQMGSYHDHRPGMSVWWDPVANSVAAEHLYDEQGWRPWTCRP